MAISRFCSSASSSASASYYYLLLERGSARLGRVKNSPSKVNLNLAPFSCSLCQKVGSNMVLNFNLKNTIFPKVGISPFLPLVMLL